MPATKRNKSESGIALFMVMSAMSLLAILVTEFTWVAQVNQRIAYDGLDQIQAQYLAKSGFKLSLLRLKAYQQVKSYIAGQSVPVPKSVLEKIWNFPFMYPIPTELPGLTGTQKDQISKFQKDSNLAGTFTAMIDSESYKFNINQILPALAPKPSPSPSKSGTSSNTGPLTPQPSPSPSPSASFNPETARANLTQLFSDIFKSKTESDQDFAEEYRDFHVDELMDELFAWADFTYERKNRAKNPTFKPKGAPIYSISELHMLDLMDDKLFDLFSPHLTASATNGVNVNTIQNDGLKILLPKMTEDDLKLFFKTRDDPEADHTFKKPEEFFSYLKEKVPAYQGDSAINSLKDELTKRNLDIIVDENQFKITVQAKVHQSARLIEAWVTLSDPDSKTKTPAKPAPGTPVNSQKTAQDSGLRVTFMRIL